MSTSFSPQLPGRSRSWPGTALTLLVIGVGGVIGANARWKIGEWADQRTTGDFPWGTLLINLSGSLILGAFLTVVTERVAGRPLTRLLIATGMLGAYTTFSTFAYEVVRLVQHGDLLIAVAYVASSLVLGLAAVWAGIVSARSIPGAA
jgi:CrcB protein